MFDQVGNSQELLQRLLEISSSQDSLDSKVQDVLQAGVMHFGLPIAILSRVQGDQYEIVATVNPGGELVKGDSFAIGDTYCQETLAADGPISFLRAGQSEWRTHPCYKKFKLEAYLGSPIKIAGETFGTLNFSSPYPREHEFKQRDSDILKLMAQWLAFELERGQAQKVLRSSEQFNRSLFEQLPIGLALSRMNGELVDVNPAYAQIIGRGVEESLGLTYWDITPETYGEMEQQQLESLRKTGRYGPYEKEYIHKDSHLVPVRLSGSLLEKDGETYIWSSVEDITEGKKVEEKLRKSEARLLAAQRIGKIGSWELDLASNELTWSDEIYRIFEIDPDRFAPSYAAFLDSIHPDDRERVNQAYTDSLKNRQPYEIVHRLLMQDGRVKYVNQRCETDYDERGEPLRSLGRVQDVTERKIAEHELRRHRDHLEELVAARTAELERSNREMEAFSYSVSHDLRSPLRAMDGYSLFLLEDYGPQLDDTAQKYLRRIRANSQRMGVLIDGLLNLSRIKRHAMNVDDLDLSAMVAESANHLEERDRDRKVEWVIQPGLHSRGDASLIQSLLDNLLDNAWKYTKRTKQARIEFGGRMQRNKMVFCLRDNGVGFDMQYAKQLFKSFQRLHTPADGYEGNGIGLATVRRIVERHGGRVWAKGTVNQGACFYFTLGRQGVKSAERVGGSVA